MPDVVDANPLYAGTFTAAFHLMGEVGLCVREQPVVGLEAVALSNVASQAILQTFRDCDYAIAPWRLGCGDGVPAADPLIVLIDCER